MTAGVLARGDGSPHDRDKEIAMREPTVVRLDDTAIVKFGPDAHY